LEPGLAGRSCTDGPQRRRRLGPAGDKLGPADAEAADAEARRVPTGHSSWPAGLPGSLAAEL